MPDFAHAQGQVTSGERIEELHLLQAFVRDIARFPLLTREQELALIKRAATGDKAAENVLIESNLRYVVKVAFSYWRWAASRYPGISLMDLLQAGCIGLLQSVRTLDPVRQNRLLTYAAHNIVWRMKRVMELYRRHTRFTESLDTPFFEDDEDSETLVDRMPAENERADVTAYYQSIRGHVEGLPERQKRVIIGRYWEGKTHAEVGLSLGFNKQRSSTIEKHALFRLRLKLKNGGSM
jgi:RNA polymerase sigma factor (sigma-70 family)